MKNKTDIVGCYNEDDFVQRGENMDELTVTITLCEYRNIITELTRMEIRLNAANEQIAELEKEKEQLSSAVATIKFPEWLETIKRVFSGNEQIPVEDGEL